LSALCDYAASIGIASFEAHVATNNYASRRVVEAAGFTAVDTITEEGKQRRPYVRLQRRSL
jgi:RimJ/RimL family protein N-acetyltransferase